MTNTQIKIRIQLDPSAQQTAADSLLGSETDAEVSSTPPADDRQVYDRRKLFLAACALLLILAGLIWFISAMWAHDEADSPPSSPELSLLSETPAVVQVEPEAMLPAPAPIALEETTPTEAANTKTEAEAEIFEPESVPLSDEAISSKLKPDIVSTSTPQPIPGEKPLSFQKRTESPEISDTPPSQSITTPVIRAQLTTAINRREPVDNIRQISLAGRSSRPIFLFLHLRDLRAETIRVNWFFQDESVAQVLLPVGSHDWRTYSSKMLNAKRLGNWRVTAQDASGNLLAEFSFEVTL